MATGLFAVAIGRHVKVAIRPGGVGQHQLGSELSGAGE
jgi:hypothetical protein